MPKCNWCGKNFNSILFTYCSKRCKHQAMQARKSGSNVIVGWFILLITIVVILVLFFGKSSGPAITGNIHNTLHQTKQDSVNQTAEIDNETNEDKKMEIINAGVIAEVATGNNDECISKFGDKFVSYCEEGDIDNAKNIFDNCNGVINFQLPQNGRTAIIEASDHNRTNVLNFLIEKKANVNISDEDGRCPLIEAVDREYLDIVDILLNNGSDVNTQEQNGNTALIIAIKKRNAPIVKSLIERQPNVYLVNKKGDSAIDLGKKSRNKEIKGMFDSLYASGSKL